MALRVIKMRAFGSYYDKENMMNKTQDFEGKESERIKESKNAPENEEMQKNPGFHVAVINFFKGY